MGELYQKLKEYAQKDYYPYHMPGHKRRLCGETIESVAGLDITEIDGFDNLHAAEDILLRLQRKAAGIYGAEESFYLVGGSTCGILSAVSAAVPEGGKLLMVRGCHKSVYHAAYLRKLKQEYLWPGIHEEFGCNLAVTVQEVEDALLVDEEIQAVLIVSPTYEGLLADIETIAEVVHARGIPLIVDEAHGAHLGFHPKWAKSACCQGADLVIQSLHKTLPSMTQTAILHVNGQLIDRDRLRRFLKIYQSSSPSYVFMAGMEEAIDIVSDRAEDLFGAFYENWQNMLKKLKMCKCLHVLKEENGDIGKLVVGDSTGYLSGQQLYDILLERYHLQMEMAAGKYVLAMFTVADTQEGYERLTDALLEIDRECEAAGAYVEDKHRVPDEQKPERIISLQEAWDAETEEIRIEEAADRICGEFINLYPPGIPLLVPGEKFTNKLCLYLQECAQEGLTIQGIRMRGGEIFVKVLQN